MLDFFWLGWRDSNPRDDGVKVRCLTAWLQPNIYVNLNIIPLLIVKIKCYVKVNFREKRRENRE